MRKAIPKPCIGPMVSRVFSTSKSSVPCRTSVLEEGIDSFRWSTGVYHSSVDGQQEFWESTVSGRVLARHVGATRQSEGSFTSSYLSHPRRSLTLARHTAYIRLEGLSRLVSRAPPRRALPGSRGIAGYGFRFMAKGNFGERLKREREMREVSPQEITKATRISNRFLEALENEDWDKLPGGVFNRGFVRAVARYLGLDEEDLVSEYDLARGKQAASAAPPLENKIPRPPLWIPVVALFVVLLVVV